MSIRLMALVFDTDGQLSPEEKLILLSLADHANDEGFHVYPGNGRIMKRTALGETCVRDTLWELTENKKLLITVKEATPTSTTERRINVELLAKVASGDVILPKSLPPKSKQKMLEKQGGGLPGKGGAPGKGGGEVRPAREGGAPGKPGSVAPQGGEVRPAREGGAPGKPESLLTVIESPIIKEEGRENTISPITAWQMTLSQLRMEMRRTDYETWVQPLMVDSFAGSVFTLASANSYARDWVSSRLTSRIKGLLEGILCQALEVKFVLRS